MKTHPNRSEACFKLRPLCSALLLFAASSTTASAISISNVPLYLGSSVPPNVLFVLANSQNMDENGDPSQGMIGAAIGGSSPYSKSEIARAAIRNLEANYLGEINLGLMTFGQNTPSKSYMYNSYYDASYNPTNYNPSYVCPSSLTPIQCRASTTKLYQTPNPSDAANPIYYNYASPFYTTSLFTADYCYSSTAAFDNSTNIPAYTDNYKCYLTKTGTSDANSGYSNPEYGGNYVQFGPTDSDYANNVLDFGQRVPSVYTSTAWFSNGSPGGGYLQAKLNLNTSLPTTIDNKLTCNVPTAPSGAPKPNPTPTSGACNSNSSPTSSSILNAGLTAIEGTLNDAASYFKGSLSTSKGATAGYTLPNSCGKNFVVLLTNGLPSVDSTGNVETVGGQIDTCTMTQRAISAASSLHATADQYGLGKVNLYVVGYALPPFALQYYNTMCSVSGNPLDNMASAGGTGSAFMANNPATLQTALSSVFTNILQSSGSSSALTSNSTSLSSSSYLYQASYSTADWTGHLKALAVSSSGASSTATWDAATVMPPAGSRDLVTYNGSAGQPFTWSNLSANEQCLLASQAAGCTLTTAQTTTGQNVLNYLRGDTSQSVASGGTFRNRSATLGDIINSNPLYLSTEDYGYSILTGAEGSSYAAFVAAKTNPTIYVGANDGMLHAFDPATGIERFAYVPQAVYANLPSLTQTTYNSSHQYFVDGSPGSGDAYYSGAWHTLVAGTLGAGGKAIFALDVTSPTSFSKTNVNWEVTDSADLGYTWGPPVIARFNDGNYYVAVNNGYNSTNQHAVLFLIQVDNPSNIVKIDAGSGGTGCSSDGLSPVSLLDADQNGTIDAVYAGDLCGNVWKFDVSSTNASQWKVAYKSGSKYLPLFMATDSSGNRQPITAPLTLGSIPSTTTGTAMVFWGTGKYLGMSDTTDTSTQSMYGVLDSSTFSSGSFSGGTSNMTRSNLQSQSITYEGTVSGQSVRSVSTNSVSYPAGGAQYGWYLDLLEPSGTANIGERVIYQARLFSGRIQFVTLIPSSGTCSYGGSGWNMELDAGTGGAPPAAILDVNKDANFDSSDNTPTNEVVVGIKLSSSGTTPITLSPTHGPTSEKCTSQWSGYLDCEPVKTTSINPRASWKQIQ